MIFKLFLLYYRNYCQNIFKRFRSQESPIEEFELKEPRAYNVTEVEIDTEADGKVAVSSSVAFQ